MKLSRRKFMQSIGFTGIAAFGFPQLLLSEKSKKTSEKKGLTILFQGDSITDGNRTRNTDWNHVMGHGYQYLISSKLWFENPDKNYMFYNRGISGNRVRDLEKRWQTDALDLNPDLISILIGSNDVGALVFNREPETIEQFETHYKHILDKTKNALPQTKIILCEPFILPVGKVLKNLEFYESEVKKQQTVIRKLSKTYDTVFVEFQKHFTNACKKAPASYWIWDGIHPMPAGHELMAREWINQVQKQITF